MSAARAVSPARPRGRAGASLVELMVAVALFTLVCTLGSALVAAQRRALGALSGDVHARAALRHAAAALELDLRAAGALEPPRLLGDSAVELLVPIAEGPVCAPSADGRAFLLSPRLRAGGLALTHWRARPEPDDVAAVLTAMDAGGGRWHRATVLAVGDRDAAACVGAYAEPPGGGGALLLQLAESLPPSVSAGAVVRVARRVRWTLYRGGDGDWQLGQRRCGADSLTGCGGVQPAAGPLVAYSVRAERTGLRVQLVDGAGAPAAASEARAIRLRLRAPRRARQPIALPGSTRRVPPPDERWLTLALRNRP